MMLDHFKWDSQVGDESVLLDQPLLLSPKVWNELAATAERMAREISAIEAELLEKPNLISVLGLPTRLQKVLSLGPEAVSFGAPRVLRFDFHPTSEGWKASEVNSDVPGGFAESSHFTTMMADQYGSARPAGNPCRAWKQAVFSLTPSRHVGFVYAPGFMEDQQLVSLLGAALEEDGCKVDFIQNPGQLSWRNGWAYLDQARLDVVVRFYQGEWLAELPAGSGWPNLFVQARTLITNPGYAILAESKRMPLIWDRLSGPSDTLKMMFPPSCDPRDVFSNVDEWVFKAAFSNTGDNVIIPSSLDKRNWGKARRQIHRHSDMWVAQRRFFPLSVTAYSGAVLYPCIGVYVIDGRCEGAYVRLSRGPVTDYRAIEAALLLSEHIEDGG